MLALFTLSREGSLDGFRSPSTSPPNARQPRSAAASTSHLSVFFPCHPERSDRRFRPCRKGSAFRSDLCVSAFSPLSFLCRGAALARPPAPRFVTSLPHYVFTPRLSRAQQRPQLLPAHALTSRFSGYPRGRGPSLAARHPPLATIPPRINTFKSVSKQTTSTPFRMNTYTEPRGRVQLWLTRHPTKAVCPERPTEARDLSSQPTRRVCATHPSRSPSNLTGTANFSSLARLSRDISPLSPLRFHGPQITAHGPSVLSSVRKAFSQLRAATHLVIPLGAQEQWQSVPYWLD